MTALVLLLAILLILAVVFLALIRLEFRGARRRGWPKYATIALVLAFLIGGSAGPVILLWPITLWQQEWCLHCGLERTVTTRQIRIFNVPFGTRVVETETPVHALAMRLWVPCTRHHWVVIEEFDGRAAYYCGRPLTTMIYQEEVARIADRDRDLAAGIFGRLLVADLDSKQDPENEVETMLRRYWYVKDLESLRTTWAGFKAGHPNAVGTTSAPAASPS